MEKNTQQPVAWLKYPKKKPELMQVSLQKLLPVALKNSGWVSEPLYTAQPVPRDVLMAALGELRDQCAELAAKYVNSEAFIRSTIDLSAIADRYASHVHHCCKNCEGIQPETCAFNGGNTKPEPVNQQMLAALKRCLEWIEANTFCGTDTLALMDGMRTAIDAAEAEQPVASCTNSDAWNCKYCRKTEQCEALKDNRNFGRPARAQPVAVVDVLEQLQLAETEVINAKAWSVGEEAKKHCKYALTAIAVSRAMLSAAKKTEGTK